MNRCTVLAYASLAAVAACTPAQVSQTLATGQLVCAVGPTIVQMADPAGAPILAMGASKAFVDAVCASIQGIAVSPPAAAVPTVTVIPPVAAR